MERTTTTRTSINHKPKEDSKPYPSPVFGRFNPNKAAKQLSADALIFTRVLGIPSLKNILTKVKTELSEKEKIREQAQNDMRKATSLSKQAILLIHQKRLQEAKKLIEKAKTLITKVNTVADAYPNITYSGLFDAAVQEFSEANIFLRLIQKSRFATPQEIGVPSTDYVLGLADVIGECRRFVLDSLRQGDTKKAEHCLQIMDEVYIELMAMDEAYMLVPGLRRKCDVARKIIEITRGDVTQEVRRNALERQLKRLEKKQRQTR